MTPTEHADDAVVLLDELIDDQDESTGVFEFKELSEKAKQHARNTYRDAESYLDHDWWECTYEDAQKCGNILGIDIAHKRVNSSGIAIYFSGFYVQGNGAAFDGYYLPAEEPVKKIKEHAPQDEILHGLAERLVVVQMNAAMQFNARYEARITSNVGNFVRVDVNVNNDDTMFVIEDDEKEITSIMNAFANWIYKQLAAEYDYLMSDDCVDNYLEELKFDDEGNEV